ncbi:GNAT family N-acetyltransferase [Halalkalibacter urbisdiaboli]|uniref:GNAT family N-acetyltransferase n=1 Tax=Halalkalibacter urbisdiaboli TaxID=1960589 RepID=UPI001FDA2FC3|nr:GNAT family N-acetyltransferase [Halalkalibacter urbisdiaboli]
MVYSEFVEQSSSKMTFDEVVTYFSHTKTDPFPMTLIALKDRECIGTVSIVENDLDVRKEYKPWLASLYVKSEYRSKGVGQKLVKETINVARELGFSELYLRTEHASGYYEKQGWSFVESVSDRLNEQIDVFNMLLCAK